MIGTLNYKLLRDCWNIKGQVAAIVLVMAAGIAVFVLMFGVLDSLKLTRDTYYDSYRFADVFASAKRAPNAVAKQIAEIPGVATVQTRVVYGMTLQMPGMIEPASGKIISLPQFGQVKLNQLYLRSGRYLHNDEQNAVLVDEGFFNAHQLTLGDTISGVVNGFKRELRVVGVVLSPEYVYAIAPGALMPDSKRFGVFWMNQRALAGAVNMQGAFNDVTLALSRNADTKKVLAALDRILKPYGGLLAYERADQLSHFFVENEIKQLASMGLMAPIIFLAVAAFLINVVMSRQIATEREQIGMLKAVGFSDWQISLHYLKMVLLISLLGAILGVALGLWMGAGMTRMYTEFFHFPILKYHFSVEVTILAVFICLLSAVAGTLVAINQAAKLPPAQAMRPKSPVSFKPSWLERLGLHQHLSFLTRMIVRQIERRPIRAGLSTLGMSLALAMLVFSFFMEDTMTHLMEIQYEVTQREDLSIAFTHPRSYQALESLKALPGVMQVEPIRSVPVSLRHGHHQKRGAITGLIAKPSLYRVIDQQLNPISLPKNGAVMNNKLAEILGLQVGDVVTAEVLDEKRQTLRIPIVAVTEEYMGLGVYMDIRALNALLDESPKVTGASLMVDTNASAVLYRQLKAIPAIVGFNIIAVLRQIFEAIMAENLLKMVGINILFASFISAGVIYNTARITLSERGRELASLRVLGLTAGEVAYVLFGELSLITLASLPLGLWMGNQLAFGMMESMNTELFRIPLYIENSTYGYSVAIVLLTTVSCFYLVWRQVEQIDLVSAQKGEH